MSIAQTNKHGVHKPTHRRVPKDARDGRGIITDDFTLHACRISVLVKLKNILLKNLL